MYIECKKINKCLPSPHDVPALLTNTSKCPLNKLDVYFANSAHPSRDDTLEDT